MSNTDKSTDGGSAQDDSAIPHAGPAMFRYRHEDHDEDTDEVIENGTDRTVEYACKYCPARADDPDQIRHSPACPMAGGSDEE